MMQRFSVRVLELARKVRKLCSIFRSSSLIRRPGYWHEDDLRRFTATVENVTGDFAEIGVARGATSRKLIRLSSSQGKRTYLFDSFRGMGQPGPFDSGFHPKGEFDVGGLTKFRAIMELYGFNSNEYSAWDGSIPACFEKAPDDLLFSFVIVDVDNYEPTRDSLKWVWPRINKGGILALDDFYPSGEFNASKAIKEFIRERNDYHILDFFNYQLFLRKEGG